MAPDLTPPRAYLGRTLLRPAILVPRYRRRKVLFPIKYVGLFRASHPLNNFRLQDYRVEWTGSRMYDSESTCWGDSVPPASL